MTQVVTVHTDFTDLDQMTQGLIGRVNDSHVILPAQEPVDVGEWVQFAVTLFDGSPAFAGVGRCVTFVDNGEDRMPQHRFDVVFDSLQFDTRAQRIYEHILALSGIDVENAQNADATSSSHYVDVNEGDVASVPAPSPDDEAESTLIAGDSELRDVLARSAVQHVDHADVESVHPGSASSYEDEDGATNPPPAMGAVASSMAAASPVAVRSVPREVNGASFSYPGGLPFPAQPPRPDIDPSMFVTPAPRPR